MMERKSNWYETTIAQFYGTIRDPCGRVRLRDGQCICSRNFPRENGLAHRSMWRGLDSVLDKA